MTNPKPLWQQPWLHVVLLAALVVLAYSHAPANGFVYDDQTYVRENAAVVRPTLQNVFFDTYPPGQPAAALYRPGLTLSLIVDRLGGGDDSAWARSAHLHNVLLHLAVVFLLYFLLRPWVGAVAAFGTSATFAVHAVLVEPVAWVCARSDIQIGFWCLVGAHVLRGRGSGVTRASLLSLVFIAALLCKESAVALPLIWLALQAADVRRNQERLPQSLWPVAPALALALMSILVRVFVFGAVSPTLRAFDGDPLNTRFCVSLMAFLRYCRLIVWPEELTVHWPPLPMTVDSPSVRVGLLCILVLVSGAVYGLRKRHLIGAGCAWFLIALLPYSNLVTPIGTVMAERYLYLPALGAALVLAAGLSRFLATSHTRLVRGALLATAGVVIVALLLATRARVADWHDDLTLWQAALRTQPSDLVAETAVTHQLLKRGDDLALAYAVLHWRAVQGRLSTLPPAVSISLGSNRVAWLTQQLSPHGEPLPATAVVAFASAGTHLQAGRFQEAHPILSRLVAEYPTCTQLQLTLAQDLMALAGEAPGVLLAQALVQLGTTRNLDPTDPRVYALRGSCFKRLARYNDALDAYSASLALAPGDFRTWYNRAMVYNAIGATANALVDLQKARQHAPEAERSAIEAAMHLIRTGTR
ncbi:MAG: tetratricopeptide repeat protein [Kiritimatiellia bacterium]